MMNDAKVVIYLLVCKGLGDNRLFSCSACTIFVLGELRELRDLGVIRVIGDLIDLGVLGGSTN